MIALDGQNLTVAGLHAIAMGASATLPDDVRVRIDAAAASLPASPILRQKWAWFGADDAPDHDVDLIRTFVLAHCAGVGDPLPVDVVRATMAARVNVLATGTTGCRSVCADVLLAMLDADVIPVVPSQGSVGAAGPASLAHILAVACGFGGTAVRDGVEVDAETAMAGLDVLVPTQKEALSLINGATLTTALGALACARSRRLLATAEQACALSFEVVRADLHCLSDAALRARRHPGPVAVAARLRALLDGSALCAVGRRPDPFSIRCAPAVLGAAEDALDHVQTVVERELNGACDNPLWLDGTLVEAGNFHGAPVALAMDHLKIALSQVASIAERRIFRMTYGQLTGLPSFLLADTGIQSGLMLAQYTAASLASECKGLAHPASVDSIPTVQHTEDHVSMGPIAARGAVHILDLLADILAIELLCGAQGLDFHLDEGLEPAVGTRAVHARVREHVSRRTDDRVLHPDLAAVGSAVRAGHFGRT